ncbi:MAG: hypothetical protein ACKOBF_08220 [Limnohabitans sp.]
MKITAITMAMALMASGCSTVGSAYKSTADTVSGWFKSDDKKDAKK